VHGFAKVRARQGLVFGQRSTPLKGRLPHIKGQASSNGKPEIVLKAKRAGTPGQPAAHGFQQDEIPALDPTVLNRRIKSQRNRGR